MTCEGSGGSWPSGLLQFTSPLPFFINISISISPLVPGLVLFPEIQCMPQQGLLGLSSMLIPLLPSQFATPETPQEGEKSWESHLSPGDSSLCVFVSNKICRNLVPGAGKWLPWDLLMRPCGTVRKYEVSSKLTYQAYALLWSLAASHSCEEAFAIERVNINLRQISKCLRWHCPCPRSPSSRKICDGEVPLRCLSISLRANSPVDKQKCLFLRAGEAPLWNGNVKDFTAAASFEKTAGRACIL